MGYAPGDATGPHPDRPRRDVRSAGIPAQPDPSQARVPRCTRTSSSNQLPDVDPGETPTDRIVRRARRQESADRARFIMYKLLKRARQRHVGLRRSRRPATSTRSAGAGAVLPATRRSSGGSGAGPLERRGDGAPRQQQLARDSAATSHVRQLREPLRGWLQLVLPGQGRRAGDQVLPGHGRRRHVWRAFLEGRWRGQLPLPAGSARPGSLPGRTSLKPTS